MKYIYIHYFFLILIILFFSFINSKSENDKNDKKENFTSQIKSYYRPLYRQCRLSIENYKNQAKKKYSETVDYIYKKIGLK
jgi:hypothetical protein